MLYKWRVERTVHVIGVGIIVPFVIALYILYMSRSIVREMLLSCFIHLHEKTQRLVISTQAPPSIRSLLVPIGSLSISHEMSLHA